MYKVFEPIARSLGTPKQLSISFAVGLLSESHSYLSIRCLDESRWLLIGATL